MHANWKRETIMPGDATCAGICKVLAAILFPVGFDSKKSCTPFQPLGVFLECGCGIDLLINCLLTLLGFIPGIVHALCIIIKW